MPKHTIADKVRNALRERTGAAGSDGRAATLTGFTREEIEASFELDPVPGFRQRAAMTALFDKPIGEPVPPPTGFLGKVHGFLMGKHGQRALDLASIPARIAGEGAIQGVQSIIEGEKIRFGDLVDRKRSVTPEGLVIGGPAHRHQQARDEFERVHGRKPSLLEDTELSAQARPLPIGVRPLIQTVVDPLNVPLLGAGAAVRGFRTAVPRLLGPPPGIFPKVTATALGADFPLGQQGLIRKAQRVAEKEKFDIQLTGAEEVAQYVKPARSQLGTYKPTRAPEESALFAKPVIPPTQAQIQEGVVASIKRTVLARIGRTVPTLDDALEAGVKSAASKGNLPIPPRTPALASKLGSTPNDPAGTFAEILGAVPGRHPMTTLLARWEGARSVLGKEMAAWWEQGQSQLKELNLGVRVRNKQVLSEEDSKALFRALHDREIDPPPHLQGVFDDIKALVAREESDMLAFDPDFKRTLMAHPDYFPRGWKDTRYGGKKQLGARPDFLKPRNDATFSEMLDKGFEPKSWNPYDMMVLRRIEGVEYRETMQLMQAMKKAGLVVPERGAPAGWVVPDVGPAFTGKAFATADGKVMFTPRLAIPKKWAKRIESMYGKRPEFVVNGRNILLWPIRAATAAKRQVLLFSGFQHLDFAIRGGAVASSVAGLRGGATIRYPSLVGRLLQGVVDPRRKKILSARQISDAPIFDDFDISFRMVANEGWQIGGDPSVLRRNALSFLEDIKVTERPKLPKRIIQRIDGAMRFWESGLFDVIYPETQMFALERMIVPKLRRIHPDWSPQQIAASAADEVNVMFSSLGEWQTIFTSSPELREFSRALIFSTNESESWLRAAIRTIKGQNKRLWLDYWVGYATFLAVVANGINFASTGKFLSANQYIPITTNDPFATFDDEIPIIGGVGYNTEFLAPMLPWPGRNGAKLFLDIVGQADTPLRWILGPVSALAGRLNVLPNMVRNQIRSSSFFGEPFEGMRGRAVQAVRDVAVPIGLGNLIQAGREVLPAVKEVIPEEEGRIGGTGLGIQASGINVRAEGTKRLLDRIAFESGLPNLVTDQPVRLWDELEPRQQDQLIEDTPELQKELELRQETAVRRDRPKAKAFDLLDKANDLRLKREQALVEDLQQGNIKSTNVMRKFRELYADIQALTAERRSTIDDVYQLFAETGKKPTDPNERALVEYYSVFAKARQASTRFDFDVMDEEMAAVETKWTEAQKAYVDRNTGRTEHPPLIQEYLRDREIIKRYLSAERDLIEKRGLSDVYKEWRASTDPNFLNAHIVLKAIIRRAETKKMAIRKNDIDLERKLWKWGYISAAENPFLSSEIKVLRKQQGGEITNRLAIDREPVGVTP